MTFGKKNTPDLPKNQAAQSVTEFALVLPVLLLLILGVFAFGHFLFTYTMAVAASREAARFGITTGLSDRSVPRYRDCDAIRAVAVRVGSVVGVTPDNVDVGYDDGPTQAVPEPSPYDDCPIGGIGPGSVEIGDRIVVTITLPYRTIVPLGIVPELTMTVDAKRTLIRTTPLADQQVAPGENSCDGTITRIIPQTWDVIDSVSLVNEDVVFQIEVIADDPTLIAPGDLELSINDQNFTTPIVCTRGVGTTATCPTQNFSTAGTYVIRARYRSSDITEPDCFNNSLAPQINHIVGTAP